MVNLTLTSQAWIGLTAALICLVALVFRKQLMQCTVFLTSAAHAFASEYNSVYEYDEEPTATTEAVDSKRQNKKAR
jgi:hypothetical protein